MHDLQWKLNIFSYRSPVQQYRALKNNEIAGAALDAYEEEPLLESPLFELENILLTPHIGGLADKQIHDVAVQSAVNCGQVLAGNTEKLNINESSIKPRLEGSGEPKGTDHGSGNPEPA